MSSTAVSELMPALGLPATGALLVVAPLRPVGETGSPSRVYAFVLGESS
jgi:kynurenine formamidase